MQPNALDEIAPIRRGGPAAGVSVVIVSYWTGPVLTAAIDSVLAQDQEGVVELILIDNGNPPDVTSGLARWAATEPRLVLGQRPRKHRVRTRLQHGNAPGEGPIPVAAQP